jgi:hypothetical protein
MNEDASPTISKRVHARVGFLGNPSDGFYGKTISFSLKNFYAEVQPFPMFVCRNCGSLDNRFRAL